MSGVRTPWSGLSLTKPESGTKLKAVGIGASVLEELVIVEAELVVLSSVVDAVVDAGAVAVVSVAVVVPVVVNSGRDVESVLVVVETVGRDSASDDVLDGVLNVEEADSKVVEVVSVVLVEASEGVDVKLGRVVDESVEADKVEEAGRTL